ncbi:methylenetetrahydrofolate reductase C-terminal domain-containing protein [bacterium]|nr:methylenetetrahydrofolate reductase C-terminal domain-containing protein [bacterium]
MYLLRKWSVRNARLLELVYETVEKTLVASAPLLNKIGHSKLEKPVAAVEKVVKGALFDCQMCGQCALSSTGMSCPMNCPKSIRNGPCGGVRADGNCEVKPDMRCVWVEGWQGAQRMKNGGDINNVQFAVDHRLIGKSSWLRVVRDKTDSVDDAQPSALQKT